MTFWHRIERRQVRRRFGRRYEERVPLRPHQDADPRTDMLPQIKHIVVLMMENHSYDNYLGILRGRGDGFALDAGGTPTAACPDGDGAPVRAHPMPSPVQLDGVPTQTWHASHLQWNSGAGDGFVRAVMETEPGKDATAAMGYWTDKDLPFYYGLARTFPLADRWFCSCLGPTVPNRRFMVAGTAHGLIDDLPFGMIDLPENGTVFDLLTHHGLSWVNYHNISNPWQVVKRALGMQALRLFRWIGLVTFKWFPPLVKAVMGNLQFSADVFPLGLARYLGHLSPLDQFFRDAAGGTLPDFCIVDPDFKTNSEEDPQDIRLGQQFAARVIDAVMHGKGWADTLLIWLYDEHGGYYDHVVPPTTVAPDDRLGTSLLQLPGWVKAVLRRPFPRYIAELEAIDEGVRRYDNYGFRVPAVVVSPYARPNYVSSVIYDHTSILKLVEHKWNLPPLTRRDAAAAAPLDMLDFASPPAFADPPDLPAAQPPS